MEFTVNPHTNRIVFGVGATSKLAAEIADLGATRAMIACTSGARARIAPVIDALGATCVGVFDEVQPHCPEEIVLAAIERFRALDADCLVSIGGGSSIDTGKPLAVETGKPTIAVPTTYSGAEVTPLYGIVIGDRKKGHRDDRALPRTVIYDPAMTINLSPYATAISGMNSLAHCVEALYPAEPNPIATLFAAEGIRALAAGLPASVAAPDDLDARTQALYGAYLGGTVVTLVGIALHHRTCHVLGGSYGISHGDANSVILPHATAYNAPAAPAAMAVLGGAIGSDDPAAALYDLAKSMGAPTDLKSLGMQENDLDAATEQAIEVTAYNPRPLEFGLVREMLQNAFDGNRPSAPLKL
jgi:alcohol dehydrogenase class IV